MSEDNRNLYRFTYATPYSAESECTSAIGFAKRTLEFMAKDLSQAIEIINTLISDRGIVKTKNPAIIMDRRIEPLWLEVPAITPQELIQVLQKW